MPYKLNGNKVMHFKSGKWSVKQVCATPEAAAKAMHLLKAVEHGFKPSRPRIKKR